MVIQALLAGGAWGSESPDQLWGRTQPFPAQDRGQSTPLLPPWPERKGGQRGRHREWQGGRRPCSHCWPEFNPWYPTWSPLSIRSDP